MASNFKQVALQLTTLNQMEELAEHGVSTHLIFTKEGWIVEAGNMRNGAEHTHVGTYCARDLGDAVQELYVKITGAPRPVPRSAHHMTDLLMLGRATRTLQSLYLKTRQRSAYAGTPPPDSPVHQWGHFNQMIKQAMDSLGIPTEPEAGGSKPG